MKSFTLRLVVFLTVLAAFLSDRARAQSILNPTDSVYAYDSTKPKGSVQNPNITAGVINKWVRTPKMNWNTNAWKCYEFDNLPFRLLYPKSYNPTANDGKKYPMLVFFHGAGEYGPIHDNETSLAHGGQPFLAAVTAGTFDGYVLIVQSPYTYWDAAFYPVITSIADYMVTNNKLDPFRIVANGLSAGGQGTWAYLLSHNTYCAAALPMSANSLGNCSPTNIQITKNTPIWNFGGGLDTDPPPSTGAAVDSIEVDTGANYTYTLYPTLSHDTWDQAWTEPNFYPFCLAAYAANPWALHNHTAWCPGTQIQETIGVAPNFTAYQWMKSGVVIPGATTNTLNVTDTGTYSCRVERGTIWSDWSHTPLVISWQSVTVPPTITVAGLASDVIPALNSSSVNLSVPSGYGTYNWVKAGSNTVIGTSNVLNVTSPGSYEVQVTQQFGCTSAYSAPFTVINANGSPKPDPASGLTGRAISDTAIVLNWNQNPNPTVNETNFEVYQSTSSSSGPWKLVGITGQNVAMDTVKGLSAATKYYFVVRPVGTSGAAVTTNVDSTVTPSDTIPPTAPGSLTITATGYNSITVSWTAATDNVGVVGYDIYVNGSKAYTIAAPATSFTIYSLVHKQSYAITVKARDLAGNVSPASPQVSGEPLINGLAYAYYDNLPTNISKLPNFPTLTPKATGQAPNVSLTPATDANYYAFLWTGYIIIPTTGNYVFQTTSDDGSAMWLGQLGAIASPYSFTGTPTVNNNAAQGATTKSSATLTLQAGIYPIAYGYFQQAGGASMTIQWSTPSSGGKFVTVPNSAFAETPVVSGTAPAYPTNAKATALSYNKIQLTWTDNSNNETGFEIYRSTSVNGVYSIIATTGANVTSFVDSTVQASTTYYYKLDAVNVYGNSGYDPATINGLTYNLYNNYTYSNLATIPSLSPTATGWINNVSLSPATTTTNFALKFSGYITINKAGSYTFYTSSDDGSDLYVGGFDSTHLVVKNDFAQGQTQRSGTVTLAVGRYPYYVTYYQGGGGDALTTSWKLGTAAVTAIPDSVFYGTPTSATTQALPTVPAAPSGMSATATSSTSVLVKWTNNATNATQIAIYRSAGNDQNYVLRANLGANAVSYVDSGLFANATYYYEVQAINAGGNSAFATEVSVTTLDVKPTMVQIPTTQARYNTTTTIPVAASSGANAALTLTGINLPSFVTLTDSGNSKGTLTVSPAASNQGTYTIAIKAADAFGGADTMTFTLAVNNNYPPTLDSIANVSMNQGDTLTLRLHGSNVNPADTLTISVSNVPNAYTLTPVSNGAANLFLHPGYAAAGNFTVTATVQDNNGYSASRTFVVSVAKKNPVTHIYTRVEASQVAPAPWNNLTGPTTTGLVDEYGKTTTVGMAFSPSSWWNPYGNGGTNTGNNSGVYPDVVLEEYYYFNYFGGPANPSVVISGLDTTKTYDLTFFASSTFAYFANNGSTQYTVGSQSVALPVQANTQNTVTLSNLTPASGGTITVSMASLSSAPGYLNALVIANHFSDSTAPAAPDSLTATGASGSVSLTWQNIAYNAANNQVYRSVGDTSHFALLATLPATSSVYTDTASISGTTQYYYKVDAVNAFGSAYSNIAGLVTPDRVPTIDTVGNVTVSNTSSATVTVTAVDDPTDHVTLTASGLPNFVTFVDNGNNTGTFTIAPTEGLQGTFSGVTVTGTDKSDSSRSTSFTINVVDSALRYTYVNLTSYSNAAPAPWNNFFISYLPTAGLYASGLVDQSGASTGYVVTLTDAWTAVGASGMKRRNGSDLYPETVEANSIWTQDTNVHRITVTGLNPNKFYNFQFFNSHSTSEIALTHFTIGSQTVALDGDYNSNKTANINGISPDATGTVVINCKKDASAVYGMLSSLVIEEYTSQSTTPFSPADLRKLDYSASGTVALQWQDRASNETGYQVWRAPDGGAYSLLATLPANTTTYVDAGLSANTAYDYIVRAFNGTNYSDYSNPIRGYTYSDAVFINTDGSDAPTAPAPWNQTKWVNQTVGNVWNNFTDEAGYPTNVGLIQNTNWDAVNNHGAQTGNNSGVFPDAVMIESFGNFIGDTSSVTLSGLDQTKAYDLTFFASCLDDATNNAQAEYVVNGHAVMLNAHKNTTGTVTMFGVVPDQNGNVKVTVYAYDSSNAAFALLGVIVVKGYTPSTASISPAPAQEDKSVNTATGAQFTNTPAMDSVPVKPIAVYPNPFKQGFTLLVPAQMGDNVLVTLTDISGRTAYKALFQNLIQGDNVFQIMPDGGLPPSIYFVSVIYTNRNERQVLKVIKQQ